MDKAKFIASVRSTIGTPFQHQGRVPGVGLDCVGVIVFALTENGYLVNDVSGYSRIPGGALLEAAILVHCSKISLHDVAVGDIMLFHFGHEPQHTAVVSSLVPLTIIHAYSDIRRVVENGFDALWKSRLVACYRINGIE